MVPNLFEVSRNSRSIATIFEGVWGDFGQRKTNMS
jgi:hypothetical protein